MISSTQTWLVVTLGGAAAHTLTVSGAAAIPVLAPLSLAVLALGAVLSIAGLVLRYVFGALTVAIAAILAWLTAAVAFTHPTSAIAGAVTAATGITGAGAVDGPRGPRRLDGMAVRGARRLDRAARSGSPDPRHRARLARERQAVPHRRVEPRAGSGAGIPPPRRDRLVG